MNLTVLAHRGYWNETIKKNSPAALRNALKKGYGFESDVRDYNERMVISHDIANPLCMDAEEVFGWLHEFDDHFTFAINIKADGLKEMLKEYLHKYSITNYFLFDMSVPQMIEFREIGLRFFTRQSEVEQVPIMYEDAAGVWIDGFWSTDWITEELLKGHLKAGKDVCLVSPDLHGDKDYKAFWERIKKYKLDFGKIMLCTDYPDDAKEYFNGTN